ncbi:Gar1/Naf1 RNA binding region-domain-containing protein [Lasiosphaeria miniovina]|uniref:H/ACA ribonucleoprotein complex non-core subunit NAF1 n=1 Tax=Lasiosphaeria miniovina TaxID=1954250 RepID=A0AA40AT86_9PEZI|nr:Gar1/Naf1 RNA binding region-domain-containing protein [Lasiosphaeria miniovina]KAK0721592.1 Gar1/Naf1 RNA binding region-domain-containing protein [Lasiosphaeria miniovina]
MHSDSTSTFVARDIQSGSDVPHIKVESDAGSDGTSTIVSDTRSSPDVTRALEAALGGEDEHPEWEVDSSPYESSSESSSSDSSSSDEDDNSVAQPRSRGSGVPANPSNGGIGNRSRHVAEDAAPPKPNVEIKDDMKIVRFGTIKHIVEKTVVIEPSSSAKSQVLDSGSVLCKEDRSVIGALADVIGSVANPHYLVMFGTTDEIKELGLEPGTPIFFSQEHAIFVMTEMIRKMKFTDASNIHDEEIAPEDDQDFSDDDKEAQAKKMRKHERESKREQKGGLKKRGGGTRGGGRGGRGGHREMRDLDAPDDGPYQRLVRPSNFGQGSPALLPPRPVSSGFPDSYDVDQGATRGQERHFARGRGRQYDDHYSRTQGRDMAALVPSVPASPYLPPPPPYSAQPTYNPQWPVAYPPAGGVYPRPGSQPSAVIPPPHLAPYPPPPPPHLAPYPPPPHSAPYPPAPHSAPYPPAPHSTPYPPPPPNAFNFQWPNPLANSRRD